MVDAKTKHPLREPIFDRNPIAVLVLGICSALAVTSKLENALVMGICVVVVAGFASLSISLIRNQIPATVRISIQILIIATLVILVQQVLNAFFFDLAKELSVFIGLIITNCIVMGRTEGYAMSNRPLASFLDGVGNGLGYSVILIAVAFFRELFGFGTVLGIEVLKPATSGGWYVTNGLLVLPPSAFFIIGLLICVLRIWKPQQVEED